MQQCVTAGDAQCDKMQNYYFGPFLFCEWTRVCLNYLGLPQFKMNESIDRSSNIKDQIVMPNTQKSGTRGLVIFYLQAPIKSHLYYLEMPSSAFGCKCTKRVTKRAFYVIWKWQDYRQQLPSKNSAWTVLFPARHFLFDCRLSIRCMQNAYTQTL